MLTILLIVAAIPLSIIIFSRNYSTKKQSVGDGGGSLVPWDGNRTWSAGVFVTTFTLCT